MNARGDGDHSRNPGAGGGSHQSAAVRGPGRDGDCHVSLSAPLIHHVLGRRQSPQLLSFLSSKMFVRNLDAETSLGAIRELAAVVARHSGLDAARIESSAWEREQVAATGIGHGVAVPHARLAEISEPIVAVGVSEAGIAFDAPDGHFAHVLFLLVTPSANPLIQLELSANIAQMFREPHCLERVVRAATFTELRAGLRTSRPSEAHVGLRSAKARPFQCAKPTMPVTHAVHGCAPSYRVSKPITIPLPGSMAIGWLRSNVSWASGHCRCPAQ